MAEMGERSLFKAVKGNVLRGESVRGVSKVIGRELIGRRVRQEERNERRALEVFKGRVAQIRIRGMVRGGSDSMYSPR